jgi:hypothetical protein
MSFLGFRMETLKHARTTGVADDRPVTAVCLSAVRVSRVLRVLTSFPGGKSEEQVMYSRRLGNLNGYRNSGEGTPRNRKAILSSKLPGNWNSRPPIFMTNAAETA